MLFGVDLSCVNFAGTKCEVHVILHDELGIKIWIDIWIILYIEIVHNAKVMEKIRYAENHANQIRTHISLGSKIKIFPL